MKAWVSLLLSIVLLAPQAVHACGEGLYTMGEGSRHRGYLAPRLATVLIFNDQGVVPDSTKAVYRGLVYAGHKVQVARNAAQLAAALQERHYDVVIADYDRLDVLQRQPTPVAHDHLLPVVGDEQRGSDAVKQRFRFALAQKPNLRQYLKQIDRLVQGFA